MTTITPPPFYPIEFFRDGFNPLGHALPTEDAVTIEGLAKLSDALCGIEVGSYAGLTASIITRYVDHLDCFDIWRPTDDDTDAINQKYRDGIPVRETFDTNLSPEIKMGYITPRTVPPGQNWWELVKPDTPYRFIFINADHRYEAVRQDILHAKRILHKGGILCGHDYNCFPGVTQAVTTLLPHHKHRGHVWWIRT